MSRATDARPRPVLITAVLCLAVLLQGCTGGGGRPTPEGTAPVGAGPQAAAVLGDEPDEASRIDGDADVEAACTTLQRIADVVGVLDDADPATAESLAHDLADLMDELAPRVRAAAQGPSDASLGDGLEEGATLMRELADLSMLERTHGAQPSAGETAELLRRLGHAQAATADLAIWEHEICRARPEVRVGEIAGVPWMHVELPEEPDPRDPAWSAADQIEDGW